MQLMMILNVTKKKAYILSSDILFLKYSLRVEFCGVFFFVFFFFVFNETSILVFAELAQVKGMMPDICYLIFVHICHECKNFGTIQSWSYVQRFYGNFQTLVATQRMTKDYCIVLVLLHCKVFPFSFMTQNIYIN